MDELVSEDDLEGAAEEEAAQAIPIDIRPVVGDSWKTKAEGKTWDHVKEAPSLVEVLDKLQDFPTNASFTGLGVAKIDQEEIAGSIRVDPDMGQFDADVQGLDGTLSSDACLRILAYLFSAFPNAEAIRGAESFSIPNASEYSKYEPFDLTELGFRKFPLNASDNQPSKATLKLSQTQLQAGVWFFRRLARDIRETNALHQQFEDLSDFEIFRRRDWARGGIIADPPGLGKTVIAAFFALTFRKLNIVDKPALFLVKSSVSKQYSRELLRFINCSSGETPGTGLHLLDLTASDYELKRVPRSFNAKDTRVWNSNLLVVVANKITSLRAKADRRCPLSTGWKYGLLNYDEVHDLPRTSAKTFPMEFSVQRHFTVGFSGTPIRNIVPSSSSRIRTTSTMLCITPPSSQRVSKMATTTSISNKRTYARSNRFLPRKRCWSFPCWHISRAGSIRCSRSLKTAHDFRSMRVRCLALCPATKDRRRLSSML